MTRLWILALVSLMTNACASLDCAFVSEQARFKKFVDGAIGSNVNDIWFREFVGRPVRKPVVRDGVLEYTYQTGPCRWAAQVDEATQELIAWRYISEPTECLRRCPRDNRENR